MEPIYWYDSSQHFMNVHTARKSQRRKYIIGTLIYNFLIGKYLYWMFIKQIRIMVKAINFFTSIMLDLKMEQPVNQFILSNMEGNYRMYLYFKYLFNVENRLTA